MDSKQRLSWSQSLADQWWLLFPFVTEVWSGTHYHYTGCSPQQDTALLLGNHAPGIDFTTGITVSSLPSAVGTGHVMAMMKQSLLLVPTIGWTHALQGSLFLARNWHKDQQAIEHKLSDMREGRFPAPYWIGLYPEGTRVTEEKQRLSRQFALERHLTPLKHLLIPRTKGFTTLVQTLPHRLTAVYDATCAYQDTPLYLSHALFYGHFLTTDIHINLHRTDISQISSLTEEQQQAWIYNRWEQKDKLLSYFSQHSHFPPNDKDTMTQAFQPNPQRSRQLTALFLVWSAIVTGMIGVIGVLCDLHSASFMLVSLVLSVLTALRPILLIHNRERSKEKPSSGVISRYSKDKPH